MVNALKRTALFLVQCLVFVILVALSPVIIPFIAYMVFNGEWATLGEPELTE